LVGVCIKDISFAQKAIARFFSFVFPEFLIFASQYTSL